MSGTRAGAAKAVKSVTERFGKDFYKRIGAKGGSRSTNGGFASTKVGKDGLTGHERAKLAGKKGGTISRRTGVANGAGHKAVKDIEDIEKELERESGRD